MISAGYQTVFEIGIRSFPWARVAHPVIFVFIGLLLVRSIKKTPYFVAGLFVVSMGSLFVVLALVTFVPSFIKSRSTYVSGKSSIVEGVIENFRPASSTGPARESFSVKGISFSYNALDDTACFHNAPIHDGPIRDGLHVRIYYDEACIQRVDVLQAGGPAFTRITTEVGAPYGACPGRSEGARVFCTPKGGREDRFICPQEPIPSFFRFARDTSWLPSSRRARLRKETEFSLRKTRHGEAESGDN